jgi:hypothetical protein
MDHNEAVRLQAVEKYLLNEFTPPQREEYEEHYFDCFACAEELKATASFMEGVRELIRQGVLEPQLAAAQARSFVPAAGAGAAAPAQALATAAGSRGFFGWLKPAFAIPALAAVCLLILTSYQNVVTIPRLTSLGQSAQVVGAPFHLAGSVRGGSEDGETAPKLQVHSGESFILEFDFTPMRTFSAYPWQLQDPAGHIVRQGTIGGDKTNQSVTLFVNGGVESAGKYNLVFSGGEGTGQTKGAEVQRLPFTVVFQQ